MEPRKPQKEESGMFRELRRKDKETGSDRAEEILEAGAYGVLSTVCENEYPYGVPLQYVYLGGAIYFHCAGEGQKMDNIRRDDRVSFCVVGRCETLPAQFTTEYESVVVFGRASVVNDEDKNEALAALIAKYAPGHEQKGRVYIAKAGAKVTVVKIQPEHICGKERSGRSAPPEC
jgi:hypothetical protein